MARLAPMPPQSVTEPSSSSRACPAADAACSGLLLRKSCPAPARALVGFPQYAPSSSFAPPSLASSTACATARASSALPEVRFTSVRPRRAMPKPADRTRLSTAAMSVKTTRASAESEHLDSASTAVSATMHCPAAALSATACAFAADRFQTTTSWPCSRSRRAISVPMRPRPRMQTSAGAMLQEATASSWHPARCASGASAAPGLV
mmetsp:Transcript_113757/g.332232  ORF Transcript_113757/g.332232 Transcript_113757/m.332232 type:complete len:207 (-) Transcript_113757:4-624(-)